MMTVSSRELGAVLSRLRLLQGVKAADFALIPLTADAGALLNQITLDLETNGGSLKPPTSAQIVQLCQRINTHH